MNLRKSVEPQIQEWGRILPNTGSVLPHHSLRGRAPLSHYSPRTGALPPGTLASTVRAATHSLCLIKDEVHRGDNISLLSLLFRDSH